MSDAAKRTTAPLAARMSELEVLAPLLPHDCVVTEEGRRVRAGGVPPPSACRLARHVDLSGAYCRDAHGLARLIWSVPVETLRLEWCCFGRTTEGGVSALCEAIQNSKSLRELDLRNNHLSPAFGIQLATALGANRSLRHVDLRWNQLGAAAGTAIASALDANDCLLRVQLAGNEVPMSILGRIESACDRNLRCLGGSVSPVKRREPSQALDAQLDHAQGEIARLRELLAQEALARRISDDALTRLLEELVSARRHAESSAEAQIRAISKERDAIMTRCHELEEQLTKRERENLQLQGRALAGDAAVASAKVIEQRAREQTLSCEESARALRDRAASVEAELSDARMVMRDRMTEQCHDAEARADQLERRVSVLQEEVHSYQVRITEAGRARREAERRADVLRSELERERTRHAAHVASEAASQTEQWRKAVRLLREETEDRLKVVERAREAHRREAEELRNEVTKLMAQETIGRRSMEGELSREGSLRSQVEQKLREALAERDAAVVRARALAKDAESWKARVSTLEGESLRGPTTTSSAGRSARPHSASRGTRDASGDDVEPVVSSHDSSGSQLDIVDDSVSTSLTSC
jgi:hypothetical protein